MQGCIKRDGLVPLYSAKVAAGFPSPGDDHIDEHIDLNKHLIAHPAATFMVRTTGDSMINAGIFPNDLLLVDRAIQARHGKVVIVAVEGELMVKRLDRQAGKTRLLSENDAYLPIEVSGALEIWGVVQYVIHSLA